MVNLAEDELVAKMAAIFWNEFVKGADMPVDHDCFDEAVSKGALENIRRFIIVLSDIPTGDDYKAAMECSFVAGKKARELAIGKQHQSVNRVTYSDAFDATSDFFSRLNARKDRNDVVKNLGKICA